jgi:hypothetical protein
MKPYSQPRSKRRARRRLFLALCSLLIASSITACDPEDQEFLIDMGIEWAVQHQVLTEDGGINWKTVGTKAILGTTGDPEADAALEAGLVVKTMETADDLAQTGAQEGDLGKIESAINMRPGDWSYREQQGALLLAQGDTEAADQAFAVSTALVQDRVNNGGDCKTLALNMLRHREQALLTQLNREPTGDLERRLQSVRTEITMLETNNPNSTCP